MGKLTKKPDLAREMNPNKKRGPGWRGKPFCLGHEREIYDGDYSYLRLSLADVCRISVEAELEVSVTRRNGFGWPVVFRERAFSVPSRNGKGRETRIYHLPILDNREAGTPWSRLDPLSRNAYADSVAGLFCTTQDDLPPIFFYG